MFLLVLLCNMFAKLYYSVCLLVNMLVSRFVTSKTFEVCWLSLCIFILGHKFGARIFIFFHRRLSLIRIEHDRISTKLVAFLQS